MQGVAGRRWHLSFLTLGGGWLAMKLQWRWSILEFGLVVADGATGGVV